MLTWQDLIRSVGALVGLSFRIAFHRKILFMGAGVVAYFGILYAMAVFRPDEGFGVQEALFVLVELPGTVLAIYLTMDLVSGERDRNTLEILFSTSISHYGIWTVRMAAVYAVLAATLVAMSGLAYLLFAEFPYIWGGLNAFVPAFLIVNLTFYLSVSFRSSNTAGMFALGTIVLVLLSARPLRNTVYYLYLNPFSLPIGVDDAVWEETVLLNRLGILGLGALLLFFALRKMESRERLLT